MSPNNNTSKIITTPLPRHIGIIMDGNGRWAKNRGLLRSNGHVRGAEVFKNITLYCSKIGIKFLTVYAFSTENWSRPKIEVDFLINLFKKQLSKALKDFSRENVKVNFLGDISTFPSSLVSLINDVKKASENNTGMVLNVALNYGGRSEILNAAKNLVKEVLAGNLDESRISLKDFENNLYTQSQPDPDIIIRTGGEIRTSNFLIWQSAYSEYFFTKTLWPDFTKEDLNNIIDEFSKSKRRFGGVD